MLIMNNIMSIRIYEYKIIKNLTKDNKTLMRIFIFFIKNFKSFIINYLIYHNHF